MKGTRSGFTLTELVIVTVIVALLIAILGPTLARARQSDRRVECSANMQAIAIAMLIYANENDAEWPTPTFDEGTLGNPSDVYYTDAAIMPQGNCGSPIDCVDQTRLQASQDDWDELSVTRAYWILVRGGDLIPSQFICPASGDNVRPVTEDIELFYDFYSMANISYGFQVPFGPRETRASDNTDPRQPIAADHGPYSLSVEMPGDDFNPDTPVQLWRPFNSPNHGAVTAGPSVGLSTGTSGGQGQNVLFMDTHVSFERTPIVGLDGDNIYTHMSQNAEDQGRYVGTHPRVGPPTDAFPGEDTYGTGEHSNTDSLIWP